MWTSLCNFLCNKLFYRRKIGFKSRSDSNENIYGKRLKLAEHFWDSNDAVKQSTFSLSMQKENVEISDDEEECCIIAEVPRRKKAGSSVEAEKKSEQVSTSINKEPIQDHTSFPPFTFKKSSLIEDSDVKEVKFVGQNHGSHEITKAQAKKFFNSQRVCRNPGKIVKCRLSYKNQLRKKVNFLQESYRLAEKYQYMQLLQSHTSFNLLAVRPPLRSIKSPPPVIEVIDLTDEKTDETNKNTNYAIESKPENQDVQIVKEISGVRSFQDLLKVRPVNTEIALTRQSSDHYEGSLDVVKFNKLPENGVNVINDYCSKRTDALEEKLRNFMLSRTSAFQEVENLDKHTSLPELSPEQQKKIKNALVPEPSEEVLSESFGLRITRRDIQTLLGLNWLNDEVINFYCNLIMARSKTNKKLPKVYTFNTFFYPNLVTNGYSSLRRWTKQVDIFSFDIILVPVHLGMHWCMSTIDFRNKSVRYYDSIGSPNDSCLEKLLLYLKAESLDKKKKIFSTSGWEKINADDIPQQMNGADCGVFSCMFAEYLTRDCVISFTQDDMPYFRKKMIIEILEKKLLT